MNGTGHSILFQVALDRMTPQARAGITDLLTERRIRRRRFETPTEDSYVPSRPVSGQWKAAAAGP